MRRQGTVLRVGIVVALAVAAALSVLAFLSGQGRAQEAIATLTVRRPHAVAVNHRTA